MPAGRLTGDDCDVEEGLTRRLAASATSSTGDIAYPFASLNGTELVRVPDVLSVDECRAVEALGLALPLRPGYTDGPSHLRSNRVAWIQRSDATDWLYERLGALLQRFGDAFGFVLDGFAEPLQFSVYEPGEYIDWHVDLRRMGKRVRKLSITVQLSDPSAYEGGGLEFTHAGGEPLAIRLPGTGIVFAAFVPHRVTPVTRGLRCSLVAWASGPPFR